MQHTWVIYSFEWHGDGIQVAYYYRKNKLDVLLYI